MSENQPAPYHPRRLLLCEPDQNESLDIRGDFEARNLSSPRVEMKTRLIWGGLLCVGYPLAVILPYLLAFDLENVSRQTVVPFDFMNGLLTTSGILFGFSSLIIISKEWVDKSVWLVILPPLALLVASGVEIGNLALGFANPVEVLVLCSATFNANVVSTGFIVGYVVQKMPYRDRALTTK